MGTLHKTAWGIVTAAILVLSGCSTSFSARDDAAEWAGAAVPAASPPARFRDLAGQIDHLEKRIDKYGSVVPQHANVWGQARMMMHRQEFERVMKQDLDL